ncbi:MAG: endonuclease [Parcubacteria group bacterium]|nr:endonuclease [Parcubacteria group bacterium]
MEGPSLFLAQEHLKPFKKKQILSAAGNTKLGTDQFVGKEVKDIFSWGKHLVFQFDTFAVRIHFMLFGTYEAQVEGEWVTGDYRRSREPRLAFTFENGVVNMYSCSVKILETAHAKRDYDYSIDIMSPKWDGARVKELLKQQPNEEVDDALLDQEIFAGVGNIIKNEVLSLERIAPQHLIKDLSDKQLTSLVARTRTYSKQFLAWKRKFVLRKHYAIYQKGVCPHCGNKIIRAKTGKRERWSYWCPIDQK